MRSYSLSLIILGSLAAKNDVFPSNLYSTVNINASNNNFLTLSFINSVHLIHQSVLNVYTLSPREPELGLKIKS